MKNKIYLKNDLKYINNKIYDAHPICSIQNIDFNSRYQMLLVTLA